MGEHSRFNTVRDDKLNMDTLQVLPNRSNNTPQVTETCACPYDATNMRN